jgi:hypothetical protein
MNRREFLEILGFGGAGLLAMPSCLAATATTTAIGKSGEEVAKLMFDGRYSIVRGHANELANKGLSCIDTGGDLVGLWYRDPDAFRLMSDQVMLGHTTWSDYQALRMLIDEVRLGRDNRIACRAGPRQLVAIDKSSCPSSCGEVLRYCSPRFDPEDSVHLVTWVASA